MIEVVSSCAISYKIARHVRRTLELFPTWSKRMSLHIETPLLASRPLSLASGLDVWLKLEA